MRFRPSGRFGIRCTAALLPAAVSLTVACAVRPGSGARAPLLQPGAPGHETRAIDARVAADLSRVGITATDVRFMQGMIGHHAQAIEMVALLATRTERDDLKLLARRIEASQADEILMMRDWLTARGQLLPDEHAHHGHDTELMPGMLTAAQMEELAAARGPAFDRLFLAGMIRHHEGALTMVRDLFAGSGAGQDSEIFAFASDVEADQRMEIARMRALLRQLGESAR
ncbi:MAG: DUF305 domain-containing protein [Vicinamibacterales bacterium]